MAGSVHNFTIQIYDAKLAFLKNQFMCLFCAIVLRIVIIHFDGSASKPLQFIFLNVQ